MARDCESLSVCARWIFEQLKPYYCKDPSKQSEWHEEGILRDEGKLFDLRKSRDRLKLIQRKELYVGGMVRFELYDYRKMTGSFGGFTRERYTLSICRNAEILVLLGDLDFQIEKKDPPLE
jgi:hypothetical protein